MANSGFFALNFDELQSNRLDYKFKRFHYDNPLFYNVGNITIGECLEEYKAPMKFDENKNYNYYGSSTNAIDEKGNFIDSVVINGKNPPSRAKQRLTKGTLVMTNLEGNKGMPAIVPDKVDGDVLSSAFIVVKPKDNINIEYLKMVLYSSRVQNYLRNNCSVGLNPAQACWSLEELSKIKFYLPSLEEQERTLPLVKAKIKILEDKIKELEEEKENVNLKNLIDRTFYEVLQIDKPKHMIDFYNHLISHNSILYSMNFDGLNDCLDFLTNTNYNIPMDLKNNFNVVKLNDLLEIPPQNGAATKKINNDNGEHYRIMVKNLSSYDENMKIHNLDYVSKDDFDNCLKEKTLQKNDILYSSCGGGCLGNMVINNTKLKAIIDTHVGYLRLKNKDDALFMYYYLTSYLGQQQIFRCITGTTNQITINPKKFAKILVPILDDATKELIIKKINDYKKEKFAIEEKISFIQSIIDNDLNKYILNGYSDDLFEIPKEGDE